MARAKEGLTDIPEEEEPKQGTSNKNSKNAIASSNPDLSFPSREEAEQGLRDALQLLEKFHNWVALENMKREAGKQITPIGIDVSYRRKPLIKDGKVGTDANGNIQYEEPGVSVQLKLPIIPEAISLPLNQAIYLPVD